MRRHFPTILAAAALLGLLILATVFAITTWMQSTAQMSIHGWIALVLGVVFSMLIGVGLMGLMFYSSRKGYDEQLERERSHHELP